MAVAQLIAYFRARPVHPAYFTSCETCLAYAGEPCLSTLHMIGTCVADGMVITGMHAARVHKAIELDAQGLLPTALTA